MKVGRAENTDGAIKRKLGFVTEMNEEVWGQSFSRIDPRIRWVITEEGDQLWHARGKWLGKNWIEAAISKGEVTGKVHLYRRPD